MAQVKIVTDSTADIAPELASQLGITVLPVNIHFGGRVFRDGIDISADDFFERVQRFGLPPTTSPPPLKLFEDTFTELMKQTDSIVSIHASSKLSQTFRVAQRAAAPLLGRAKIITIDSQLVTIGLGILVTAVARLAAQGASLEEVVRLARGLIPRVYIAFFAESLDYLERSGRIRKAQALLGSMLSIKPLLIMEEGDIVALEKVRTRAKAIEKLVEFIVEFARIQRMVVLHSDSTEDVPVLIEQTNLQLPNLKIEVEKYGPAVATHVGPGALGVVVFEGL